MNKMNKFFIFAVVVLTACVFASCGYKSEETPLNDELVKYTVKNNDETISYGVKNIDGKEIVPPRFESIKLLADNILASDYDGDWLYSPSGELIHDRPSESITEENGNLIFVQSYERYLFTGDKKYRFAQEELCCIVYNKDGDPIIAGGRVIYLTADNTDYFIVFYAHDKTDAYNKDGKYLFSVDNSKIRKKLPEPEWRDIAVERIITDQPIYKLGLVKTK